MTFDTIFPIVMAFLTIILCTAMAVTEVKKSNRQVPYGKVFVKEFVEMVDDIKYAVVCNKLPCVTATVNRHSFKVKAKAKGNGRAGNRRPEAV